jgi:type VI secretion system protein ImpM
VNTAGAVAVTGLFGKLPAHGDFVRRALPGRFIDPWDAWLSAGMLAAVEVLGDGWLAGWETARPFRFHLESGACGPDAVAGVVLPSEDMVGRRFPLTLAAILPAGSAPDPEWLDATEAAGRRALGGGVNADSLAALLPPPRALPMEAPPAQRNVTEEGTCRFWEAEGTPSLVSVGLPPAARLVALMGLGP